MFAGDLHMLHACLLLESYHDGVLLTIFKILYIKMFPDCYDLYM